MNKKTYLKLEYEGGAGYLIDLFDGDTWIHEVQAGADVGNKYVITFVEMTEEEFKELPEFDGF